MSGTLCPVTLPLPFLLATSWTVRPAVNMADMAPASSPEVPAADPADSEAPVVASGPDKMEEECMADMTPAELSTIIALQRLFDKRDAGVARCPFRRRTAHSF